MEDYNMIRLNRMLSTQAREKIAWLDCIKFYNLKIDEHQSIASFFYYLKESAVNKVEAINVEMQYLEMEIKNEI